MRSDITDTHEKEQKILARMRKALVEADRANEAKSAFLSTMSHDLRTPLNGVLSFTDFALRESNPEKKQAYLEKVKYSGNLLLNLVNDTLELSRIERGKILVTPETVTIQDVGPPVIESLRPMAEKKGVELISGTFPDQYIYVDKLKHQKIWLNLLSNAIKYTPAGDTVHAFIESIDPPQNGRNRRIVVEDTGIGMSEAFMKRMFEPFAQENRTEAGDAGGTGLAIVKRIVDLLGGTISVRSKRNEGTRFEVDVPIPAVSEPETERQSSKADSDLTGKRVLLCEDNLLNQEIAGMLLESKGVSVACAETAKSDCRSLSLLRRVILMRS
jgi:signal transduction histidine kinase